MLLFKNLSRTKTLFLSSTLFITSSFANNDIELEELTSPLVSINRGFVKEGDAKEGLPITYTYHAMAQGEKQKKTLLGRLTSCLTSIPPTHYTGYARVKVTGTEEDWTVQSFDMPQEDAHVGRTAFQFLTPSTHYTTQVGYVTHSTGKNEELPELDWSQIPERIIMVPPETPSNNCSFVYGSCAWIAPLFGVNFGRPQVSQIFRAVATDITERSGNGITTDAVIQLGDKFYSDALGPINEAKTFNAKVKRNNLVNTTSGMQAVLDTGVPLYEMRDDHEDKNNSNGEPSQRNAARTASAQRAYTIFQRPQGADTEHNWYTINGNLEAFMMDLRTELLPSQPQAMSSEQLEGWKNWLSDESRADRVKPIFMSTTALMFQGDAWSVAPEQLSDLLNYIRDNQIKYVSFFSGDIHVGKSGLWQFEDESDNFILEVASSAFHQINKSKAGSLKDTCDLTDAGGPLMSAKGRFSPTVMEDHFTRIDIDHDSHTVVVLKKGRNGKPLFHTLYNLEDGTFENIGGADIPYKMPSVSQE